MPVRHFREFMNVLAELQALAVLSMAMAVMKFEPLPL